MPPLRRLALVVPLVLLAAPGVGAQEPAATPSPTPATSPAPPEAPAAQGATGSATPGTPERGRGKEEHQEKGKAGKEKSAQPKPQGVPAGEIRIRADVQEVPEKGHYQARGFVDLQTGDIRIQADRLDLYETPLPGGGQTRKVVAEGNVVFLREDERLAGEKLTMDLATDTGVFEKAYGYVDPGVFVEGDSIERLNASTYRIKGAHFTSCAQPNPRWNFTASSATLEVNDKIVAKNVLFKVKSLPLVYIPIFVYPIQHDQRSTGFLFPHFGYSSLRGFNVGSGFFWAMGRSFDQTFYFDNYSRFGYGLGHEFRYALDRPSRGDFRSYAFRIQGTDTWDFDLNYNAVQMLPAKFRATVNFRRFSNLQFQQQIQDNLDLASTRRQRSSASIQRSFGATNFQLLADANDTYFGQDQYRVNRHLPSLKLSHSSQRIGRTGIVFSYDAAADRLVRGNQDNVDQYWRYEVNPQISRPFALSYLRVNPKVQVHYTRYGTSVVDGEIVGPAIDRPVMETSVEVQGPTFSKVFNAPGNFYSERYKHEIGPEIVWSYRTKVDNFDAIPKFDGSDYLLGTDQVQYALVQRLLAKRPGRGGKKEAWEFFNWRIQQTYYVQIGSDQGEFDPNYSSAFFGTEGEPSHYSPILSRMRFKPTRDFHTDFTLEYDVNFKQIRTLSLSTGLNGARGNLQATWSRARRIAVKPENRVVTRNFLRGSASLQLVPGKLTLDGSANYDLLDKSLIQATGRLRWSVQCCGFSIQAIQYDFNDRQERQIQFSIELANIGSMGNFMGQGSSGRPPGF